MVVESERLGLVYGIEAVQLSVTWFPRTRGYQCRFICRRAHQSWDEGDRADFWTPDPLEVYDFANRAMGSSFL